MNELFEKKKLDEISKIAESLKQKHQQKENNYKPKMNYENLKKEKLNFEFSRETQA